MALYGLFHRYKRGYVILLGEYQHPYNNKIHVSVEGFFYLPAFFRFLRAICIWCLLRYLRRKNFLRMSVDSPFRRITKRVYWDLQRRKDISYSRKWCWKKNENNLLLNSAAYNMQHCNASQRFTNYNFLSQYFYELHVSLTRKTRLQAFFTHSKIKVAVPPIMPWQLRHSILMQKLPKKCGLSETTWCRC